ncbi:lycopene cyclase domain-containing protein [Prauserella sp. PE36]|uniref:Lycopene cyclase domain-containing protein n=1 Tax=Prauserella endophytica TaxID=1592324 RepID=A0ABY2S814_9PSEU|nr:MULTISPECIES: lycopene cyclase domain-containing protein [Prauserella]PXY30227.1 lycopene cyclase [Prauserella coralliicola]RBM22685.1 lycopene cyclase domain-containing protein [Prauserella sp. PE36]TKG72038.1 lycopene cyclase domain-containing protein [Prauserella endophytica]
MESTDHLHYLLVLAACVAVTLPLEFLGAGVYRRPRRLVRALLPAAALFAAWDLAAIAGGVWSIDSRYTLGVYVAPGMPLEEALFFLVIPLCGLLTFEAVRAVLGRRIGARA